jgi:hypothetical protein
MRNEKQSDLGRLGSIVVAAAIPLFLMLCTAHVWGEDAAGEPKSATQEEFVRPPVPKMLEGFYDLPDRRYDMIYRIESNAYLPDEVVDFLMKALREPDIGFGLYHRMCCALSNQRKKTRELYDLFVELGDAVILGYLVGESQYSYIAERALREMIVDESNPGRAMYAMIQLASLEDQGKVKLGKDYDDLVISKLENPKSDEYTLVGTMGLVCMRRMPQGLEIARRYVDDPDSELLRFAVAALGMIGDESDLVSIEPYLSAEYEPVKDAAVAAKQRILERIGK